MEEDDEALGLASEKFSALELSVLGSLLRIDRTKDSLRPCSGYCNLQYAKGMAMSGLYRVNRDSPLPSAYCESCLGEPRF